MIFDHFNSKLSLSIHKVHELKLIDIEIFYNQERDS